VQGNRVDFDESRVLFAVNTPGTKIEPEEVRRGESFKLFCKSDVVLTEDEFQLLKCGADGAMVRNVKTGQSWQIITVKKLAP
jgi:hypothetical protein